MPSKPALDVEQLVNLACTRHKVDPLKVDAKDVTVHLHNGDSFTMEDPRRIDLSEINKFVIRHPDLPIDEYIIILVEDIGAAGVH